MPVELLRKLEEVLRILEVHDAVGLDPLRGAAAREGGGIRPPKQTKDLNLFFWWGQVPGLAGHVEEVIHAIIEVHGLIGGRAELLFAEAGRQVAHLDLGAWLRFFSCAVGRGSLSLHLLGPESPIELIHTAEPSCNLRDCTQKNRAVRTLSILLRLVVYLCLVVFLFLFFSFSFWARQRVDTVFLPWSGWGP